MKRGKIGVFDSGFGGLSILRGIVARLPQYDYLYLGDSARAPYGDRSSTEVYEFTRQGMDFLFKQGCELIILACNTAASQALRKLQQAYLPRYYPQRRILGVLIPAAEAAVEAGSKRVGILATEGTVKSGTLPAELAKLDPRIQVSQLACPLLVPLVEAGETDTPKFASVLQGYLKAALKDRPDSLVLGCTHYGLIEDKIKALIPAQIQLINEEMVVPEKLADYLKRHPEIEVRLSRGGKREFYSTDAGKRFRRLGSRFYGERIEVELVKF